MLAVKVFSVAQDMLKNAYVKYSLTLFSKKT